MAGKQLPQRNLVSPGLPKKGEAKPADDQVSQDISKAKVATDKFVGKVKEKVTPAVAKRIPKLSDVAGAGEGLISGDLIKKLTRTAVIAGALILLLYIASLFFKTPGEDGAVPGVEIPTPTVAPYLPYNPSIYAEEELVLKLEEDIKVLDRELSTAQLKESILTLPVLDFEIEFED